MFSLYGWTLLKEIGSKKTVISEVAGKEVIIIPKVDTPDTNDTVNKLLIYDSYDDTVMTIPLHCIMKITLHPDANKAKCSLSDSSKGCYMYKEDDIQ